MENMEKGKQRNSRLNVRFVLVFSVALMLAVMCTFGITMAYFGGRSNTYTADFILKAGVSFKENVNASEYQRITFDTGTLVPGANINAKCLVTVTSGDVDNLANTAVNGLLRANFKVDGHLAGFLSFNFTDDKPVYVYKCNTEEGMEDPNNIVARLVKAADNNFYLVNKDASEISDYTELYEIPCKQNNGVVSLMFSVPLLVKNLADDGTTKFDNSYKDKTAELKAEFIVIQSEFYGTSVTPLEKNYKNAKPIFDAPTGVTPTA